MSRAIRTRWRPALGLAPDRVWTSSFAGLAPACSQVREGRVKPGRDEKVLAGWNGMMLRAFAEASPARWSGPTTARSPSGTPRSSCPPSSRMAGSSGPGRTAGRSSSGYLEDHAMVADGLLALHEADARPAVARRRPGAGRRRCWASSGTRRPRRSSTPGADHEALVVRPRSLFDSAVPCGASVAADVLLRLAVLTGEERYRAAGAGHHPGGGAPDGAVPLRVRPLPGGAGLPPRASRRGGRRVAGRTPPRTEPGLPPAPARSSAATCPSRVLAGGPEGSAGRPAAPGRQGRPGRPADRVRLRALRLPGAHDRAGGPRPPAGRAGRGRPAGPLIPGVVRPRSVHPPPRR